MDALVVDRTAAERFLDGHRIALIGASSDPRQFGNTVYKALRDHGYDVVPVNPNTPEIGGVPCAPDMTGVDGELDGAMVMVAGATAITAVQDCIDRGVRSVWLFKGAGGPGAASAEAVAMCERAGVDVVAGACPLMFLEPVGWFHRAHRSIRRMRGTLVESANG
jgi:predicted CoA-binding protein